MCSATVRVDALSPVQEWSATGMCQPVQAGQDPERQEGKVMGKAAPQKTFPVFERRGEGQEKLNG